MKRSERIYLRTLFNCFNCFCLFQALFSATCNIGSGPSPIYKFHMLLIQINMYSDGVLCWLPHLTIQISNCYYCIATLTSIMCALLFLFQFGAFDKSRAECNWYWCGLAEPNFFCSIRVLDQILFQFNYIMSLERNCAK